MAIKAPTTTPCPDEIIDHWMAELSGAELKCLLYIVRHTFGYGKQITGDAISLDQFQHGIRRKDTGEIVDRGTGLASRSTITTALNSLVTKGLVKRTYRTSTAGDAESTLFALDVGDNDASCSAPPLAPAAGAEGGPLFGLPPTAGSTQSGPPPSTGSPKSGPPAPKGGPENGPPPPGGSPKIGLGVVQKLDPQETTRQEIPVGGTTVAPGITHTGEAQRAQGSSGTNYHARAREDQTPIPLHQGRTSLDPRPDWVLPYALRIQEHWSGALSPEECNDWCECLWEKLHNVTPAQREQFLVYFCNDWLKTLNSPRGVLKVLGQDIDRWKALGYPASKTAQQRKVPAHVQWEHDHAYKPPKDSPEKKARLLADIRKYKGEEFAQRWLEENEGA